MAIKSQSGINIYLNNRWSLIQSGFLILTWAISAFHLELVAPTMSILAINTRVDYNDTGSVLASRGAGYFIANVLGVILQNIVKKHSEGLLVCAFILPSIVLFATPFVTSLILLCVLFFVQGIAQGFTDLGKSIVLLIEDERICFVGGNNILLTMWGVNAAVPLNTAHFGYGIGAIFVNLLVRPFLTQKVSSGINSTLSSVNATMSTSKIIIPYSITAVLCVLMAIGHLFLYIRELKNQREKLEVRQIDYAVVSTNPESLSRSVNKEDLSPYSPRTCGRGFFQYGLTLSSVFICYTFFIAGNDQTFSKFFFTYLKFDKFNISTGAASWGIILYWLSYSVGRLIGAILSFFLSVNTSLNIVWFGGLCLAIAWFIYVWIIGLTSTSLFVLGSLTGLVFSSVFSLSFALFNQRLNVIRMLLALLLCGIALGGTVFQKIAAYIMDRHPNHFPILLIVCILMSIMLYIVSNFVYFFHQRKNLLNGKSSVTDVAVLSSEGFGKVEQQMTNYLRDQHEK